MKSLGAPLSHRRTLAAAGIVVALSAAGCAYAWDAQLIDDAFIFFRYAGNLVAGHGLVFNPGERVEGYTSLLWVVLLAGTTWAGIDPEFASRAAGAVFATLAAVATMRLAPSDARDRPWWSRLVAPALLAVNPAWSLWAVHGLETALFTLCVTLAMAADLRADDPVPAWTRRPAAWWGLATLARPEGALLYAASAGLRAARSPRRVRSRAALASLATYGAIVGSHVLWRWAYYGSPLPNTFHAKVGLTPETLARGAAYLREFFLDPGAMLFLLLVPAAIAARRRPGLRYLFWMVAVGLAATVIEGGDAFPAFRFVMPLLPALYVLVQEGVCAIAESPRRWGAALAVTVALAAVHLRQAGTAARAERDGANGFTGGMKLVGAVLRSRFPPDTLIALNPVGAIPYVTGFPTIDMLGLTDAHISRTAPRDFGSGQAGHEKGDGRYVLSRRPDIILLGNVLAVEHVPVPLSAFRWPVVHRSERELARQPDLERMYERDSLPIGHGLHLLFLKRRGFPEDRGDTPEN